MLRRYVSYRGCVAPCARPLAVVPHRTFATDWNLAARMFNRIEDKAAKAEALTALEKSRLDESKLREFIAKAPVTTAHVDFGSWRRRILTPGVVEYAERTYKALPKVNYVEQTEREVSQARTELQNMILEFRQDVQKRVTTGRENLSGAIEELQQLKLDLPLLDFHDAAAMMPEAEKKWRADYDDKLKSLYE